MFSKEIFDSNRSDMLSNQSGYIDKGPPPPLVDLRIWPRRGVIPARRRRKILGFWTPKNRASPKI